uniref:Uncharacterized protein n=1 Tax=Salix viminalis TaxID=40686 RepID=A0A6N2M512_SALVM
MPNQLQRKKPLKREKNKKKRKIDSFFSSSLYISLPGSTLDLPSRVSYFSFDNSISNSL